MASFVLVRSSPSRVASRAWACDRCLSEDGRERGGGQWYGGPGRAGPRSSRPTGRLADRGAAATPAGALVWGPGRRLVRPSESPYPGLVIPPGAPPPHHPDMHLSLAADRSSTAHRIRPRRDAGRDQPRPPRRLAGLPRAHDPGRRASLRRRWVPVPPARRSASWPGRRCSPRRPGWSCSAPTVSRACSRRVRVGLGRRRPDSAADAPARRHRHPRRPTRRRSADTDAAGRRVRGGGGPRPPGTTPASAASARPTARTSGRDRSARPGHPRRGTAAPLARASARWTSSCASTPRSSATDATLTRERRPAPSSPPSSSRRGSRSLPRQRSLTMDRRHATRRAAPGRDLTRADPSGRLVGEPGLEPGTSGI